MATRYYGAAIGADTNFDVTEAASTTSLAVELVVTYDATGANKVEVLKALDAIRQYIVRDTYPPV